MGTSSGRLPAGQLLPQPSVSGSERIAVPSRAAGTPTGAERLAHAARLVALQQKKGAGSGVSANRTAGTGSINSAGNKSGATATGTAEAAHTPGLHRKGRPCQHDTGVTQFGGMLWLLWHGLLAGCGFPWVLGAPSQSLPRCMYVVACMDGVFAVFALFKHFVC